MKEKICIECGKYPSEYAQTICEFCMGITNKDDYIEQLQQENNKLKDKLNKSANEEAKQCEICGEYFTSDELTDTTEYINGGCGDCCEQCIEDGGMICL